MLIGSNPCAMSSPTIISKNGPCVCCRQSKAAGGCGREVDQCSDPGVFDLGQAVEHVGVVSAQRGASLAVLCGGHSPSGGKADDSAAGYFAFTTEMSSLDGFVSGHDGV